MKNIIFVIAAFMLLAPAAFGQNSAAEWPTPKFTFEVEYTFNGKASTFEVQEIVGLDSESPAIEYRKSDPNFKVQTLPGLKKFSDITLKKGIFVKDNNFFDWYGSIRENTKPTRGTIIIKLLDEDGNPTMVWKLQNAFPKLVSGLDENKSSFETLVLAHEGMTISNSDQ